MNIFNKYYKEKKTSIDNFCSKKANMYACIFEEYNSKINLLKNKTLPYGWHWLYFSENYPIVKSGADGHPKRGKFLPSFKGCKRMYAGSEVRFKKDILLNSKVKKISKIKNIENKSHGKKIIYFVTINHLHKIKNEVFLEENQNLVFISKDYQSKRKIFFVKKKDLLLLHKKNFSFNNIMLFRYSAITYNSHRIHYDIKYTREEEGYKDLLVHGPFLAKYALDEFMINIKSKLKMFEFKMLRPVLVNEKINLKIFRSLENINKFKIIITNVQSKEVKLMASCYSK